MPSKYKYPLLLLLQAFLISTIYPSIKFATELDSVSIGWLRIFWAVIGLGLVLLFLKRDWKIERKDLFPLSVIGNVGLGLVWLIIIISTRISGSAITALLVNTSPFWALGIGLLASKDKFVWKQFLGMLLAIFGIGIIMFFQNGGLSFDSANLSVFLPFVAAFGIGFYGVFIGQYVQKYGGLRTTFWGLVFSLIAFTFFITFYDYELLLSLFSPQGLLIGIYTGFMVTAIPQLITAIALGKIKASIVFIYNLTIPVFTVLLDYFLFDELVTWPFIVGALVTLAGVYITQMAREKPNAS